MKQLVVFTLMLLSMSAAFAQTTWYARTTGNWNGAIWSSSPAGAPGSATIAATDNVIIQDGVAVTVNVSSVVVNTLTVGEATATASILFDFPLTITGATVVRGSLSATTNSLPMVVMAGNLVLENGSSLNNNGRRIDLAGNWTNNGATLSLATFPVRFTGTATQTIGGSSATTFNSIDNENTAGLIFNQTVTLAGFGNSYLDNSSITVSAGRTFTVGDGVNAHGFYPSVYVISGAGNFIVNGLVNFHCEHTNGIIGSSSNGTVQVTGTRSFSNDVTYYFQRSGAQSTWMANPVAREVFFFGSGVKSLTEDLTVSLQCIVQTNNTLDAGPFTISGSSSFTLQSGATLQTASPNGVIGPSSNGTIRVTGTRTFNNAANYIFSRTGNQGLYFGNTTVGNVDIFNGGEKQLTENVNVNGTFYVGAVLSCNNFVISGTGTFQLEPTGSTLIIGSADGITSAPTAAGNIQTATRNFTAVDYWYRRSGSQVTGSGLPGVVRRLIIENSGTAPNNVTSLTNSTVVQGGVSALRLVSGVLNTGANILTLNNDSPTSLELFGGRIAGTFRRAIQSVATPTYVFPVGTLSDDRTATVSFTTAPGGTSPTLTASFQAADPGGSGLGALGLINYWNGGFWRIDQTGLPTGSYNLSLNTNGISGISAPGAVRIIRRPSLAATWVDAAAPNVSSTASLIQSGSAFTGFSEFGLGSDASNPLPVELLEFRAQRLERGVELIWTTASEKNNAGFEIQMMNDERRLTNEWKTLGFVKGNGTTSDAKSYSFVDRTATGKVQYRLKQIDFDGTFEILPTVEVDAGLPRSFELGQNYPNPFNPTTVISYQLPVSSDIKLVIYDMLGRELQTLVNTKQEAGRYSLSFNASTLASGVYFYRLQAGTFSQTKKMLLIK